MLVFKTPNIFISFTKTMRTKVKGKYIVSAK